LAGRQAQCCALRSATASRQRMSVNYFVTRATYGSLFPGRSLVSRALRNIKQTHVISVFSPTEKKCVAVEDKGKRPYVS
jgi:hypothetical protein